MMEVRSIGEGDLSQYGPARNLHSVVSDPLGEHRRHSDFLTQRG
jgi:hypothetical protein